MIYVRRKAKNVRLAEPVLALQEAAARRHKSVDEMASEAVMEGLKTERLNRVQTLLAKGQRLGQRAVSRRTGL